MRHLGLIAVIHRSAGNGPHLGSWLGAACCGQTRERARSAREPDIVRSARGELHLVA
jgi:hypothetical protein